jgi:hypothetical protein
VHVQDRNNFLLLNSEEAVEASSSTNQHARPHIIRDDIGGQYLCWTRKDSDEDVSSKAKNGSDWEASTERVVSELGVVEDHCHMAFNYDGARYTVYHRNSTEDIYLAITTWDGTTWTPVAEFALTGSAGANYPTVYALDPSGTTTHLLIAARGDSSTDDLLVWECVGAQSACDSATEFGSATTLSSGTASWTDPKAFIVTRPGGLEDRFIAYQKNGTETVRIQMKCDGDTSWTDVGALPQPAGYSGEYHFGVENTSSVSSVEWDGTEFWIPFLAENPDASATVFDLVVYHGDPTDAGFCGP